jgi:hypothetical protein
MSADAIAIDRCPYQGCALEEEHAGDHVPRYRLVQRFAWAALGLPEGQSRNCRCVWPGRCEIGDCPRTAAALYATHDGRAVSFCLKHEEELVSRGPAGLLKGGAA